jgi:hypothetical protein
MKTPWMVLAALALGGMAVKSARAQQYSIMPTLSPPAADEVTDGTTSLYELGTLFQSNEAGEILAIRYWQPNLETGAHVGNIWNNSTHTLLATVNFPAITEPGTDGWVQAALTTPLTILANTTYVVSVNSNVYYADTSDGLSSVITNGPLSTLSDSPTDINGVFNTTPGDFPSDVYQDSNYYRDVVFQPAAAPEPASLSLLALGGVLVLRRRR